MVNTTKMTDLMDYEQEVKKVYPEAYGQAIPMLKAYLIVDGDNDDEPIGEFSDSRESSWQYAYDNIKKK